MKKFFFLAALIEKNKNIIFKKIKFPNLNKGQVLVKLKYASLCRSQLMEFLGQRNNSKFMPHMFGHEAVGVVVKKNKYVKKVNINDKVILSWVKSNGFQASKAEYFSSLDKKVNSGILTTFSEYTVCSENNVIKKPPSMPIKYASFFGCAFLTGAGMAYKFLNIKKDKNIVIYGLGGIGISILLYLKSFKNLNVVVVDNDKKKINFAKKIGFKKSILVKNYNQLAKSLNNISKGKKFDFCFETCGEIKTIEQSINFIKNDGTVVFCSHPESGKKIKIDPHELIKGKKIFGTWGGNIDPDVFINKVFPRVKKNLECLSLIDNKYYFFKDINQAFKDFNNKKVFRPVIKF